MLNIKIRLNKYISYSGICSRRKADNLIKLGLISVNGKIIKKLGYKIFKHDIIKYNNKILKINNNFIYIILNKPKKYITTVKDNYNRLTILSLLPNKIINKYRIFPIGRLDYNTCGMLLLTNDGSLCNKLLHPKNKIKKTYKIILNKNINNNYIKIINNGVKFKEGKLKINDFYIKKNKKNIIYLSIYVGWNRIIHRLFNKFGYKILYLQRISFSNFKINNFNIKKEGQYIILNREKFLKILNKKINE
ncbi:MAG: pseudouridine synthase [Candidatus Shikimatogenerans sp. JK-2022]|nr:pseudouridine synthase [Candidatus Shikimatogenerans bostrichidophilus]